MSDQTNERRWCILRTSAARTLPLAASLGDAGFAVWSPVEHRKVRASRGRKAVVQRSCPITPTFVFARAESLPDLYAVLAMPLSPHPSFSIFHYAGRVPLIADREIANLRQIEARAQLGKLKEQRYVYPKGAVVDVKHGAFTGLTGVVEGGDGKTAVVNFGGLFGAVKIATFLIRSDAVRSEPSPGSEETISGTAALAA